MFCFLILDSDIIQQARADTCMLRYNTSTVLKLYAIARHIEPPGAVIFSTDDLLLQLNATELAQLQKQISVSPLKHPKMLKKIMNKEADQRSRKHFGSPDASNAGDSSSMDEIIKRTKIVQQQQPTNNFIFNDQSEFDRRNYDPNKLNRVFAYPNLEVVDKPLDVEPENDVGALEEYENYLNSDPSRKISVRTKYPQNRDVRSKNEMSGGYLMEYDDIPNESNLEDNVTHTEESKTKKKTLEDDNVGISNDQNRPETLWDLELEKETVEAIKGKKKQNNKFFLSTQQQTFSIFVDAKGFDFATRSIRHAEWNQNLLSSISSTGVLVKPIDPTAPSTIDFVFVLNVRESEAYPPLFLPEDLACVEDKLNGYRSMNLKR